MPDLSKQGLLSVDHTRKHATENSIVIETKIEVYRAVVSTTPLYERETWTDF